MVDDGAHPDEPIMHLTQRELSRRWRLSVRTLEKWRSKRTGLRFLKLGGRVVYRLADVEAFEKERERTAKASAPDDGSEDGGRS